MWTFVSMFFNLDKFYKKNNSSDYNSSTFYIEKFKYLIELNIQLIIYTDQEVHDILLPYSSINTKFIITTFEEIELFPYIQKLYKIRENNPIYHNSRNIPEWCLTTVTKNEALNKAIDLNPFNSEIFCWMDFGFYRPHHSYIDYSIEQLKNQLKLLQNSNIYKLNSIHIGFINWINKHIYNDINSFYKNGGPCTVSGQFFFGNKEAFNKLKINTLNIFKEHISQNYFHADEPIFFYTILKYPDLFTPFATDYFCAPFDVIFPQKRTSVSTGLLIPNLLKDNQINFAKILIERLLISHSLKKIVLSDENLKFYEKVLLNVTF